MSNELMETTANEIQANNIENLNVSGGSIKRVFTTLTDKKQIFNLDNGCDFKINDCKGKQLTMVDVLVKIFVREEEDIDNETGELVTRYTNKKICIIIDDDGKSYVTGSKMFTNKMIDFIQTFGIDEIKKGVVIEITEAEVSGTNNKSLSFKLI